jgi:hypothetical protein
MLAGGCGIFVVGAAATMAGMVWNNGEGRRSYDRPYERVASAAVAAASRSGLASIEADRGKRKTVVAATNADGQAVNIRVTALEDGKKAEVRVKVGMLGDYVVTTLVFDAINEDLGLAPESRPQPPAR